MHSQESLLCRRPWVALRADLSVPEVKEGGALFSNVVAGLLLQAETRCDLADASET